MVPGDHHDPDTRAVALGDCRRDIGADRVRQANQANKVELNVRLMNPLFVAGRAALRDAKHTQALGRELTDICVDTVAHLCRYITKCQNRLWRPFANGQQTGFILPNIRHRRKLGGDGKHFYNRCRRWQHVFGAERCEDSLFHRVEGVWCACEGRSVDDAHHIGIDCVSGWRLVRQRINHLHPVFGERARLVNTEDCCRAERLDHGDAPREDVHLAQSPGTNRQKDGEDDGKLFGNHRHRKAKPGQNPF